MNKIATIDVFVDTENDGSSASRFDPIDKRGRVILRPTNSSAPMRSKSDLADVFAHEMGHIIGRVLDLPDQMDSIDDNFAHNFWGTPVTRAMYRAEEHAWELAAKMRPIDPLVRDVRLGHYRAAMEE